MKLDAPRIVAAAELLGGSDRHCWLMRRVLNRPQPASSWPSHIQPAPFKLEDAREAHFLLSMALANVAADVPDYTTWLLDFQHGPEFDAGLCYSAWDEHGMVGFVHGWTSAFIKDLVVHPRARHQGIGLALLNRTFETYRLRGEVWVDLKVMENNRAARCLYERAGLHYVQRLTVDQF